MTLDQLTRRRRGQRGDGKLGAFIAILVLVAVAYLLIKIVPVRVRSAEMSDRVERAVREFAVNNTSYDQMIQNIIAEGSERDIAIQEEDIKFEETPTVIKVEVEYEIPLSMIWGEWPQKFDIDTEVPRL